MVILAANLALISLRHAVGRWYNIPTNTILAYNTANIGLSFLGGKILASTSGERKLTFNQNITLIIVSRICVVLSALYLTSKLTIPMPTECAMLTTLASATALFAIKALEDWRQGKNA